MRGGRGKDENGDEIRMKIRILVRVSERREGGEGQLEGLFVRHMAM